jgi:hypothetical protein
MQVFDARNLLRPLSSVMPYSPAELLAWNPLEPLGLMILGFLCVYLSLLRVTCVHEFGAYVSGTCVVASQVFDARNMLRPLSSVVPYGPCFAP